jgi:hypothetical protein
VQMANFQRAIMDVVHERSVELNMDVRDVLVQLCSILAIWTITTSIHSPSKTAKILHELIDEVLAHYEAQLRPIHTVQ